MNIEEKERIEINFWRDAEEENPEVFSVPNLINKFKEADIFIGKLVTHSSVFKAASKILELGSGQGWASCMVKFYHPDKEIIISDISPYAVKSVEQWERIFKVKIDGKKTAKSYETGMDGESVDLVYCFASAHHFIKHDKTFKELNRILKPGGTILYLYEPVCRKWIYPLSYKRANAKRPMVPEDVLIYKRIENLARKNGFSSKVLFSPSAKNRGIFGAIYYSFLGALPFLQKILPCSADLIFIKK